MEMINKLKNADRLIIALDGMTNEECFDLIEKLAPLGVIFKVGLQLIIRQIAKQVIERIHSLGGHVFLDGKFNDIPKTMGLASEEAMKMGVLHFNVMASAGIKGMKAAVDVAGGGPETVLAVTVLTSKTTEECEMDFGASAKATVLRMARDAVLAGVGGLICSAQEVEFLRTYPEVADLKFFTPGIRPKWAAKDDQKRIVTPEDAIRVGVYKIIVGRPVTRPPEEADKSPQTATHMILNEIATAMGEAEK